MRRYVSSEAGYTPSAPSIPEKIQVLYVNSRSQDQQQTPLRLHSTGYHPATEMSMNKENKNNKDRDVSVKSLVEKKT